MKIHRFYHEFAKYYDLIYSWKDYKKEAERLKELISKNKKSKGNSLLDAGCGTGRHIKYLRPAFLCTGVDINESMLKIARKNVKGVVFRKANMMTLNLDKKFDAVVCLFSSIGYAKTYANLRKTLQKFSSHLKRGGVVIIEPWIRKSVYKPDYFLHTYDGKDMKIARISFSKVKGNVSLLEMHYLIADKYKGIRHFVDKGELGVFEIAETLKLMREAGFSAKFLRKGFTEDRGLFVGVKK